MVDLGASINVMPYAVYASLNLGPLKETRVVIQLADLSNAYPRAMVEDVLVKVNDLIFPADFFGVGHGRPVCPVHHTNFVRETIHENSPNQN